MGISEKDIKLLWGLSAGICAYPACGEDCIVFLAGGDLTLIGEMAHVIARSAEGPRGVASGGDDTYDNLILLCPTHHRLVDKAPTGAFTADDLHRWKRDHERNVRERTRAPNYVTFSEMARGLVPLLQQNEAIWRIYGPESATAQANPVSNAVRIWTLRKLSTIVPNNRRIVTVLEAHRHLMSAEQGGIAATFIEHAQGFEVSAYERQDSVPRFPQSFEAMIFDAAR